jgi:drug/metabolite transporter (DMT)-like permease
MTPFWRGCVYGLAAASLWGGLYVVADVVLVTIPPFTLLMLRLLIGVAMMMAIIAWQRRGDSTPRAPLVWRTRALLIGVGMVGFGFSVGAQFVGTDLSTALNGSLITSASPAFIVLFAAIILRERLTWVRLLAIGLAMLGVVLIIDPRTADFNSLAFAGNLWLAFAALTWGLYSVLVRRVSGTHDTATISLYAMIGGLVVTVPAMLIELQTKQIGIITAETVWGVLYLSVLAMTAATWLWNRAFALVDAGIASLFFFAQPLVGVLLSAWALQQTLTASVWFGGGLIAAGVLVAMLAPRDQPQP